MEIKKNITKYITLSTGVYMGVGTVLILLSRIPNTISPILPAGLSVWWFILGLIPTILWAGLMVFLEFEQYEKEKND